MNKWKDKQEVNYIGYESHHMTCQKKGNLRTGDAIEGRVRAPKDGERYFALIKIERVNGRPPEEERDKLLIDNLTPVHPTRRLVLEHGGAVESP